jgi:hypothetical protein
MSIPGSARTRSLAGSGRSFVGPPAVVLLRMTGGSLGDFLNNDRGGGCGPAPALERHLLAAPRWQC